MQILLPRARVPKTAKRMVGVDTDDLARLFPWECRDGRKNFLKRERVRRPKTSVT